MVLWRNYEPGFDAAATHHFEPLAEGPPPTATIQALLTA
jgi:hypothetical protein